jgi:predicted GNAT family acetyltransferase
MAGQRIALPGFVEVSAVCTHPDFRGRGFARELVSVVAEAIWTRGETPILHTFSSNRNAIRVYEDLGFERRRGLHIVIITPTSL